MMSITQILADNFTESQTRLEESINELSKSLSEYGLEENKSVFKHLNAIKSATLLSVQFADLLNVSNECTNINIVECFTDAKNFYEAQRKRKKLNLMPLATSITNDQDRLSEDEQAVKRKETTTFFSSVLTSKLFKIIPYILYNNAIKYSPSHNVIKTSCWITDSTTGYIEVSNNGPHIPEEEKHNLTKKNYRGTNSVNFNNEEGFGLGLYFTDKILRLCGYSMSINSQIQNSPTLIIDGKKVPISQFTIRICISKGNMANGEDSFENEEFTSFIQTMFLHEYNNLLTTIHNNIFNIENYIKSNADTLSETNVEDTFAQLQEQAYRFELDLIKYIYALDKSFIQFSSKYEFDLKPYFISGMDYYNSLLAEKEVSIDAMIITNAGHFLSILQQKKSIYASDSPDLWINAVDKIKEFPKLLLEFLSNIVKAQSTIEITITPVIVKGIKNLNMTISFETDKEVKLYNSNTLPQNINYHNFILSYINYILKRNNSTFSIKEEYKTELEIII